MDRWATKDTYEREEDEAERLVRPAPKVKPPRDDKKRERVQERDPDTDGDPDLKGDPDLSLNYKNVGGALALRIAEKWVKVRNKELDKGTRVRPETLEKEPGKYEKVSPNEPDPPDGKPRPARKPRRPHLKKDHPPHPPWRDERPLPPEGPRPARPPKPVSPVPVPKPAEPEKEPKSKPPGWVRDKYKPAAVLRRFQAKQFGTQEELESYLEEHPGAHEEKHWVTGDEPEDGQDQGSDGVAKKKPALHALVDAGYDLREMGKDNGVLGARLKDILNPQTGLGGIARNNPDYPTTAFFQGFKLPPGLEKMGDLLKALEHSSKPRPKSKSEPEKAPEAKPEAKPAEPEKAPEAKPAENAPAKPSGTNDENEVLKGVVPEEPKKKPEEKSDKPQKEKSDKPQKEPEKEPQKPAGPQPKRRTVSKEERAAMQSDIIDNFPPEVGLQLMQMHPDDYQRVKAQAMVHANVPVKLDQLDEHVAQLTKKGLFQLDPAKVGPPKQAKNAHGQMVPFEALGPEEQQEAWAQFRNEVVAASIGMHQQVARAYRKGGAPSDLALMLTQAKLGGGQGEDAFEAVLEDGGSDRLSPKARLKVLNRLQDPKAKALATRYFQGQDYLDARDTFLDPKKENGISEHSSPRDIIRTLEMGSAMLEERAKAYPEEHRDPALGSLFRQRVLRRLDALVPGKALLVQRAVDKMDADDYDDARKTWEKEHKEALRERAKRESQRDKIELKFFEDQHKAEQDATFRKNKPVKPLEERWAEKGLDPSQDPVLPPEPAKPPRYDLTRGLVPRAKDQFSDLAQQTQESYPEVAPEDIIELTDAPPKSPPKPPPTPKRKQASMSERMACRVVGRYLAFSTCRA